MNWHAALAVIAGMIQVASLVPYIKDMLHGKTRPNIVSWSLWTIVVLIGVFAQFSAGASWSVIFVIMTAFNTGLVTILCLFGYGYRSYGRIDIACFVLALLAIVGWRLTGNPLTAIALSISADFLACIPTLLKTFKDPYSENLLSWFMIVVAATLGVFSTTQLNAANLLFPGYLLVINLLVACQIYVGQRVKYAQKQGQIGT